jgi:high-affinity K+ transport system ATPase subunit B
MLNCFEKIRSTLEEKIIALINQGKIKKTRNTQALSVTLFGLVIPAFTVQSVFMGNKSVDSKQYADCLELLFTE